jgi:orotidine-5'-phosphate decarboxylase
VNDARIVVALDYPGADQALAMADQLDPARCRVKVGKELFTRAGPAIVNALHERKLEVFLDLKFHDIPNTVAGACSAAADLGVWMLNVHASGGSAMLEAARTAVDASGASPLLIAVTVLTSQDEDSLKALGIEATVDEQVARLAQLTQAAGLDGVVCSAREIAGLRAAHDDSFALVTPGIRPASVAAGDQKRVMTPAEAVRQGASYLVIGRAITGASDPTAALACIEAEMRG